MNPIRVIMALLLLALASCTSTETTLLKGALKAPIAVSVVAKPDASGDPRIRAALEKGFLQRGLTGGAKQVKVEFEDHWYWDIVMYLRSLDVRFFDAQSGALFGASRWRQKGFHTFPSQESAVAEIFKSLDESGAFLKP